MNISDKKIVIATHVYTTGPAQDLEEYLNQKKCTKLLFIGHPLFYDPNIKGSGFEYFENGQIKKSQFEENKKNFGLKNFFGDFYKNIKFTFAVGTVWDLYVGSDNLNALSGILLRRLGRVKKVVYYVIDYNPKRFKNSLINLIYHKIDQFCVRHSDETWNLSSRMELGRKKYFNFSDRKQKVVPIGIWFDRFKKTDPSKKNQNTLVYFGHITKKQGIQHVISAVPSIVKVIADFKFMVIGGGNYLSDLKAQVKELGVSQHVFFSGFVKNHKEVEKMLSQCSLAIAPYEKYDDDDNLSFTYFADPGKIKSYLAGGLPVLLTDVPHNAHEIMRDGCGTVIEMNEAKIAEAVVRGLKDKIALEKMRQNARAYAKKFDWNIIFEENLTRILKSSKF